MKTLEMVLRAENKKQNRLRLKLYMDVFMQAALYAWILLAFFSYNAFLAGFTHFIVLGLYQVFSCTFHPKDTWLAAEFKQYEKWMQGHLLALVPVVFLFPLIVPFMISTAILALWYFWITLREFEHYTK